MANHAAIAETTGLEIYFCDPHSPWQRGSNENTNGLLRQYLPKGSDLSFYGPGLLDDFAAGLNARPPANATRSRPPPKSSTVYSQKPQTTTVLRDCLDSTLARGVPL